MGENELHAGRLTSYPGNYQAYARLRQQRYDQELKTWEAQQGYIAKQEDYIRRVHYGQLHKQAQSRQKALDRLEREHVSFRVAVRKGYRALAKGRPKTALIDATKPAEDIHRLILGKVERILR